jgi:LuxR family maltose regulon positive regulatory protein
VALVAQGRLDEAERSLERAERTVWAEVEPAAGMGLHYGRGMIELARGRYPEALAAIRTAERLGTLLVTEHTPARRATRSPPGRSSSGPSTQPSRKACYTRS